jgi:hypothetical protein
MSLGVLRFAPFKWTKSADRILAAVKRSCHKAQQTLCGELGYSNEQMILHLSDTEAFGELIRVRGNRTYRPTEPFDKRLACSMPLGIHVLLGHKLRD